MTMSDINERLIVRCPYHEAPSYLAAFVAEHQVDDGTVRIALRLPVKMFADGGQLIEGSLVANLYPLRASSDPHPTYSVAWSPKTGVSFPEFAGALAIEKGPREYSFGLIVSGQYESPSGVGTMFDATLSRRFTHGSARDLLQSIAGHVENACAHDEAARAGYSPLTHFARDWSDGTKMLELSGMVDLERATVQQEPIGREAA
jgi:hypothetical protein